jgi:ribosomal protein L40E
MKYVCIRCETTWIVGKATNEPSGGLCDRCITQYIRKKQKERGFHDCFRKGPDDCVETECSYWDSCIKELVKNDNEKN